MFTAWNGKNGTNKESIDTYIGNHFLNSDFETGKRNLVRLDSFNTTRSELVAYPCYYSLTSVLLLSIALPCTENTNYKL